MIRRMILFLALVSNLFLSAVFFEGVFYNPNEVLFGALSFAAAAVFFWVLVTEDGEGKVKKK